MGRKRRTKTISASAARTATTKTGRPSSCTPELEKSAWEYAKGGWKIADHAVPSVVGLCSVLDVAKSTIYDWAKRDDNQFSDILGYINSEQELVTFNMSLRNEYNATIAKLLLGKHGYHEKTEVDNKTRIESVTELTPDEAKAISNTLDDKY